MQKRYWILIGIVVIFVAGLGVLASKATESTTLEFIPWGMSWEYKDEMIDGNGRVGVCEGERTWTVWDGEQSPGGMCSFVIHERPSVEDLMELREKYRRQLTTHPVPTSQYR
jgi:hypothetical protein